MLEYNFSLFSDSPFSCTEMTLISDDAPVADISKAMSRAMTAKQLRGMEVFTSDAACSACHSGRDDGQLGSHPNGHDGNDVKQPAEVVERMFNGNCEVGAYDQGVTTLAYGRSKKTLESAPRILSAIRWHLSPC